MTLTRLTLFFKGFAICQFLLLIITVSVAGESYPGSFEETLERHLTAIVSRDLQGILATVAEGDSLTLILPDGSLIKDKAAYADLHEAWFSDPDWRMEFTEVRRLETAELCSVLLRYSYRDTPEGPAHECYLYMAFQQIDGEWRLVFDQNTRIS